MSEKIVLMMVLLLSFILGYSAGWDGKKTHDKIELRKKQNPIGW